MISNGSDYLMTPGIFPEEKMKATKLKACYTRDIFVVCLLETQYVEGLWKGRTPVTMLGDDSGEK
jgi:hypothetical protein